MTFILVGVLHEGTKNEHTKFQAVILKNKNSRTVQNTTNYCRKSKVKKITFQISKHTKCPNQWYGQGAQLRFRGVCKKDMKAWFLFLKIDEILLKITC